MLFLTGESESFPPKQKGNSKKKCNRTVISNFQTSPNHLRPFSILVDSGNLIDCDPKDMVLQVLATCCYSLQRCIFLLDGSGIILDREAAEESSEMLLLHIKSYAWLAAYFYNKRVMVFRIRPKLHYIYHQAVQLREWRINMSVFATWTDESFLGKIKVVATACHGKTMTSRVFQRYLLCLALLVHRHNQLDESIG